MVVLRQLMVEMEVMEATDLLRMVMAVYRQVAVEAARNVDVAQL